MEIRRQDAYFYSTHTGGELDLFWRSRGENWGVEFKYSDAPGMTKSMNVVIEDLKLSHLWVVYPGKDNYRLSDRISVKSIMDIGDKWE